MVEEGIKLVSKRQTSFGYLLFKQASKFSLYAEISEQLVSFTARLRDSPFCNFVVKVFGVSKPCAKICLTVSIRDIEVLWCEACEGSALKKRWAGGTTSHPSYLHYGFKSKKSFIT